MRYDTPYVHKCRVYTIMCCVITFCIVDAHRVQVPTERPGSTDRDQQGRAHRGSLGHVLHRYPFTGTNYLQVESA